MNRRAFLAVAGTGVLGSVAGCFADYPSEEFMGESVRLVPTDEAYEWHQDDDARFVDARGQRDYNAEHVTDAVLSPATHGLAEDDPVEEWATDVRIVTYCVCPHTLAGRRAGALISNGYEDVFALDEGLNDWQRQGYPTSSNGESADLSEYEISGVSKAEHAGEYVWVRHPETDQREVSSIDDDGSYELHVQFAGISTETVLELDAPDYTIQETVATLTAGRIGE